MKKLDAIQMRTIDAGKNILTTSWLEIFFESNYNGQNDLDILGFKLVDFGTLMIGFFKNAYGYFFDGMKFEPKKGKDVGLEFFFSFFKAWQD